MENEDSQQKMRQLGFSDGAFLSKSIEDIDFNAIKDKFKPRDERFKLPRIAFLGLYSYMSMIDQRHICKALGFEYYSTIQLVITNDDSQKEFATKWRDITKAYTKLIVIGNASGEEITELLYKRYIDLKKPKNLPRRQRLKDLPIFIEHQIPILFESEIIKMHPDYPNMDKSVSWKSLLFNSEHGNRFIRQA